METKSELKPKSFRINDETAEKFKEISAQIGGNQQEALAKLIEAYEFQAGKEVLTDKKGNIEEFERYITCITRMYMGSLEDNQNVIKTVRTEFEALLKSKDTTIQDLQSRCERAEQIEQKAKEQAELAEINAKKSVAEVNRLQMELKQQETDYTKQLQVLEEAKQSLSKLCANLTKQIAEVEPFREQIKALNEEISSLREEKERLKVQLQENEFTHKQAIWELREQLQNEKIKYVTEIEEYQNRYKKLLEQ